jgi:hypothetical protein
MFQCADTVLGCVFSDVCSKLPTQSHEGYKYFITLVDDMSHKVSIAGLWHKSHIAQQFNALTVHVFGS